MASSDAPTGSAASAEMGKACQSLCRRPVRPDGGDTPRGMMPVSDCNKKSMTAQSGDGRTMPAETDLPPPATPLSVDGIEPAVLPTLRAWPHGRATGFSGDTLQAERS